MSDRYIKVSAIRQDGGAHETSFLGYGAESCALHFAGDLEQSKYVRHVVVFERHVDEGIGAGSRPTVTWEVIREHKANV